jgi:hypothetical protein
MRRPSGQQGLHQLQVPSGSHGPPPGRDERQHAPRAIPRPGSRRRHRRPHPSQADAPSPGCRGRPTPRLQASTGARGEHRRDRRPGPEAHPRRGDEQLRGGRPALPPATSQPRYGLHQGRQHLRPHCRHAR